MGRTACGSTDREPLESTARCAERLPHSKVEPTLTAPRIPPQVRGKQVSSDCRQSMHATGCGIRPGCVEEVGSGSVGLWPAACALVSHALSADADFAYASRVHARADRVG